MIMTGSGLYPTIVPRDHLELREAREVTKKPVKKKLKKKSKKAVKTDDETKSSSNSIPIVVSESPYVVYEPENYEGELWYEKGDAYCDTVYDAQNYYRNASDGRIQNREWIATDREIFDTRGDSMFTLPQTSLPQLVAHKTLTPQLTAPFLHTLCEIPELKSDKPLKLPKNVKKPKACERPNRVAVKETHCVGVQVKITPSTILHTAPSYHTNNLETCGMGCIERTLSTTHLLTGGRGYSH
eukprot:Platyproteum_vivax@DN12186_c0_g1_i1.p1